MNRNFIVHQACALRVAVGVLAAIALHYTIYFVASVATGIWERKHGDPVVYGDSPLWVLLWGSALLAVLWKGKPRPWELMAPFTFGVGFWFLEMVGTNFHPDTAEQTEVAAFALAMFLSCLSIWSLALLLALVRWILTLLAK